MNHDSMQDVIAVYQRDVDRTLLADRLKLSMSERLEDLQRALNAIEELRDGVRNRKA